MSRRTGIAATTAGLLLALLPGVPALADAPDGWPVADWAATCDDAGSVFCIEEATITPWGADDARPLADFGLTATATSDADAVDNALTWRIDGWEGLSQDLTKGQVSLVIRTGEVVPRMTVGVAGDLAVERTDDGNGNNTLRITGVPTHVDWTTGDLAEPCERCSLTDLTADEAGTGYRFEGRTQDLSDATDEFVQALDGAYLATDAQVRTDRIRYEYDGTATDLFFGVVGGPQLDVDGMPVHNHLTAWLPNSYFLATGQDPAEAVAAGQSVTGFQSESLMWKADLPTETLADGEGVRIAVPDVPFGAGMYDLGLLSWAGGEPTEGTAPGIAQDVVARSAMPEWEGVSVQWSPPLSNGGLDIDEYRVRFWTTESGGQPVATCLGGGDGYCEVGELPAGDEQWWVTVSAVNALGEGLPTERELVVTDAEGPSVPRNVKVAAGTKGVTVSWSAPESSGTSPIEGYTAYAYTGAAGGADVNYCQTTGVRTCVLTGITSPAKLWISVAAHNEYASSPESARLAVLPWVKPGAARTVRTSSAKNKVTVSWTAPAVTGNAAINGYRVALYTAAKGGTVVARCTGSGSARSCTTPALKKGKTYYAAVTATNAVGASPETARVKVVVK